ncbi:putative membrane-associated kinase regulator 1 [Iris pallida]|uniref:Membrane-associated kinase regulator 1 n=1 Tax=Iris pallida TaxID=29817 RepID=A0AAX6HUA7_IRIPA|nr:putative membrane-associated kinase regulator 1 [Iris pallida]
MGIKSRDGEVPRRRGGYFPSPSSSSSSDFEFTVSVSPSSRRSCSRQCPADELFYKGQILPLHLSPRISMVRTLLLASSSSCSDTATTASRDSNGSSSSSSSAASAADLLLLLPAECDSSRPSSVTEEEEARRAVISSPAAAKRGKYFSSLANRFSSVFLSRGGSKKDAPPSSAAAADLDALPTGGKRANTTAKQVIKKYVSKVKPLYEKLSNKNPNPNPNSNPNPNPKKKKAFFSIRRERDNITLSSRNLMESMKKLDEEEEDGGASTRGVFFPQSHSFSGNLRYPRRKRCAGSCPSSMGSSPAHSGLLRVNGGAAGGFPADHPSLAPSSSSSSSSMQELQNAIQGAIAHCKSAMVQSDHPKKNSSDEPNCRSLDVTSVH